MEKKVEKMDKVIKVAVIGSGERGTRVAGNLLRDSNNEVKIVALYDPDESEMKRTVELWKNPECKLCKSYQEAINAPGVEWVMVFSPNAFHCEHILAAFAAGKNVFSEKPLATSIEDCQAIYDAHRKSGKLFATGFVLRYSRLYRKAKELLDSGVLGRILSINADENISSTHGSYIMTNWRRKSELAGPHILEKCCHDLDLINWFCGSLPSKVAAFGSRDFFIPENEKLIDKFGERFFQGWRDPHKTAENAFLSDKDLLDTQVGIALYRNGIKVHFQATMSNIIPERRMYFSCTEGTMIIELYKSTLTWASFGDTDTKTLCFKADGHGGGDDYIMKELYEVMINGGEPACSGDEGLESAVFALALDRAMREEKLIDLEPIWKNLNR